MRPRVWAWTVAALLMLASAAHAQPSSGSSEEELAKKLSNPVANLISVPLQSNWDFDIGPADAMRYTLNVQPVIPFSLTRDWNLITRTIVPIIHAESPVEGGDSETGLGDILQSFFLSPEKPLGGWIIGAGPVFLYPTATEDALGSGKWGVGPTAVVLRQDGPWTYGILANHVWSFAGDDDRPDVNSTFLQPFLNYTTKMATTFGLNTESTYDWERDRWTVPINATVAQLVRIGGLPVSFMLGARYYAERPAGGPDWGIRFDVTFLFPK
jgi:hypothetical protein